MDYWIPLPSGGWAMLTLPILLTADEANKIADVVRALAAEVSA